MTKRFIVFSTVLMGFVSIYTPPASADTWMVPRNPARRFLVQSGFGDEAVLDRETGLVWELAPSGTFRDWSNAHRHCNTITVGNRLGWRLPSVQELASLLDPTVPIPGPTLPAGHPFVGIDATPGTFYWTASSSTVESFAPSAYYVSFTSAVVGELNLPNLELVWCVRGGQGVDTLGNNLAN